MIALKTKQETKQNKNLEAAQESEESLRFVWIHGTLQTARTMLETSYFMI